jgi:hypothetical protein
MTHWHVGTQNRSIVITCRGHDREGQVQGAVDRFAELMKGQTSPVVVIADLREMTGYESNSRQAWLTVFREHRGNMQRLILVGARSRVIRMGAAVVGAYAGVPVRFVDAWDEVFGLERTA